ncbi:MULTISPECIES: acyltransferase [unclassified Acinetobacter]|uniref:acyltransferase n=1 Tax=unclassified Acinetobacter TaxID=196816 RepID=UPI001C553575|nr:MULTISPECIES: acyltransferase [unclassified Acinetobacter]
MSNQDMWKLLFFISKIFSYLPVPIFNFIWRLSDIFDGNMGAIIRYIFIAGRLKKCGKLVFFGSRIYIESPENLSLGNNVSIHHQSTLICSGGIEIGDAVAIAHNSSILSTNHTWNDVSLPIKYNPLDKKNIIIEDDVWIGCGVRILAGSFIPKRTIIAAGAVLSKKLPSNGIYGGIPAKLIKRL